MLARVEDTGEELRRAKAILRSRLNLQGTTMGFSTERRDRLWWLMVSTDGNAARAILSLLDEPEWHADLPRMIRGLFARQQRGRWETTVANAWGTVAAREFAAVFEADPVTGSSVVSLGDAQHRVEWPDKTADTESPAPVDVPWSSAEKLTLNHQGPGRPGLRAVARRRSPDRGGEGRLSHRAARGTGVAREPGRLGSGVMWPGSSSPSLADADMTWVVVEDPIPPGATILGSGLGGDSYLLSEGSVGDRRPVFTERDFDSYRAYFHYVPKGTFTVGLQRPLQHVGRLPATARVRVEAMYMPEMFAEEPVAGVSIR